MLFSARALVGVAWWAAVQSQQKDVVWQVGMVGLFGSCGCVVGDEMTAFTRCKGCVLDPARQNPLAGG